MAESDSPRLGLRRWSAGTDTPSRAEFDTGHANLDDLTAIDRQGTFAARPAAGVRGTYYWDTTNLYLWRDDGSGWVTVGSRATDNVAKSSAVGTVPLTIDTVPAPVANLIEAKADGVLKFSVTPAGNVVAVGRVSGTGATWTNDTIGNRIIDAIGANGQTADTFRFRNFAAANLLTMSATGVVTGTYLNAGAGQALLGNSAYSAVANMTKWSGTPALEVYAATGGAGSAFNDFIYLRHLAADATAVTRRLGMLFKVGDEAASDAARTGAIYIESSAANFATPKLVLARSDADVMTFDTTGATVHSALAVSGTHTITPGSAASLSMGNTRVGVQNSTNDQYFRIASTAATFSFYAGGSHSDTGGNSGGGSTVASLTGLGLLTLARINVTSTADATEAQASPAFMVGSAGSTNLIFSTAKIQARNNGIAALLTINGAGGSITLGANGAVINTATGALFKIDGRRLTIQDSAPSSPVTGDVWIDT